MVPHNCSAPLPIRTWGGAVAVFARPCCPAAAPGKRGIRPFPDAVRALPKVRRTIRATVGRFFRNTRAALPILAAVAIPTPGLSIGRHLGMQLASVSPPRRRVGDTEVDEREAPIRAATVRERL